jgi:hypothetical protein
MKTILSTLLMVSFIFVADTLSAQNDICLKIGGNYYINCKRTIAFGNQSIFSITGNDSTGRDVSFDLFSATGTLDASFKNGQLSGPNVRFYELKNTGDILTISDLLNKRFILKIVYTEDNPEKRKEFHVWADFYLPNGERFQCTPDETNVPMLNMMKGATFKNSYTAIQLN